MTLSHTDVHENTNEEMERVVVLIQKASIKYYKAGFICRKEQQV